MHNFYARSTLFDECGSSSELQSLRCWATKLQRPKGLGPIAARGFVWPRIGRLNEGSLNLWRVNSPVSRAFTRDGLRRDSVPAPPSSNFAPKVFPPPFPVLFNKRVIYTRFTAPDNFCQFAQARASATLSFDDRFGDQNSFVFPRDTCREIRRLKFVRAGSRYEGNYCQRELHAKVFGLHFWFRI